MLKQIIFCQNITDDQGDKAHIGLFAQRDKLTNSLDFQASGGHLPETGRPPGTDLRPRHPGF